MRGGAEGQSRTADTWIFSPGGLPSEPLALFLRDRQNRGLSQATIRFYSYYLQAFNCHYPTVLARRETPPMLGLTKDELLIALAALPCSPGGKHAYLRALRAFYSWAEESGFIDKVPTRGLRLKVPKPLRNVVKLSDIPRLLDACLSLRDRLAVSLLADTGLRLSELASVRTSDVDAERQTIVVWGKGARQRLVRFGPGSAGLLARHLDESTVVDSLLGLTPNGISIMLYRLGKATGLRCNAHAFRRTFACESVRNGMNLFYVQSLLGHSTLTMTRLYAEQVDSEDAIAAYQPIVRCLV